MHLATRGYWGSGGAQGKWNEADTPQYILGLCCPPVATLSPHGTEMIAGSWVQRKGAWVTLVDHSGPEQSPKMRTLGVQSGLAHTAHSCDQDFPEHTPRLHQGDGHQAASAPSGH